MRIVAPTRTLTGARTGGNPSTTVPPAGTAVALGPAVGVGDGVPLTTAVPAAPTVPAETTVACTPVPCPAGCTPVADYRPAGRRYFTGTVALTVASSMSDRSAFTSSFHWPRSGMLKL